ncbi:ribosomal protein S18 acetylase RimI-like enzyme [Salirhabdus euzebyi]|uniref:Ribosomal protein S18 acetylase RimI-like enzyme n=1 Tax=Salirhabdus euzebyi TaxID=394506 RepID=A0A841Q6X8_9BACI|nr:GNAT family N-acetyltransferase [Salirhabdus euzebyi]MBB6454158.1 ribosomal protein S18 acetylase RimI-like enzyme [Salirhabdus euzebyi]
MEEVRIVNDLTDVDWEELQSLFHAVGWDRPSAEKLKIAFTSSYLVSLAYLDGKLIGCGRVISDGQFYGSIYDVIVHPLYQGNKIGKKVMDNILHKMSDIPFIHLTATHGKEGFYNKLGLRKHKTAMARYLDANKEKEYLE